MKILIVDPDHQSRQLLSVTVENMGYEPVLFGSGEEALEGLQISVDESGNVGFGLVLIEFSLPGVDGVNTAMRIKKNYPDKYLPIIFITYRSDSSVIPQCLQFGDDYVVKPVNVDILELKIAAHLRNVVLHKELAANNAELLDFRTKTHREYLMVESIFSTYFERHVRKVNNLKYYTSPVAVFNGDLLLAELGPTERLTLMIGDVTGHGLPAAIGALPIYSAFKTMVTKGLSISVIAKEFNKLLRLLLPDNMMVAATILQLHAQSGELVVWSGGMPSSLVVDPEGNIKNIVRSAHPPLAVENQDAFDQSVEFFQLEIGDRIVLFTDGVEESRNIDGELFGEEKLHSLFDGCNSDVFSLVKTKLKEHTLGCNPEDDVTIAELVRTSSIEFIENKLPERKILLPWSMLFNLTPAEIRQAEPIPVILQVLENAPGLDVHQDYFSTVLSELYSNALEHGLLKLDSQLKSNPEGFHDYYRLRNERLNNLNEGQIIIQIGLELEGDTSIIVCKVSDTGDGFDYQKPVESRDTDYFGRGINLVKYLCSSVIYSDGGRTVEVKYELNKKNVH